MSPRKKGVSFCVFVIKSGLGLEALLFLLPLLSLLVLIYDTIDQEAPEAKQATEQHLKRSSW